MTNVEKQKNYLQDSEVLLLKYLKSEEGIYIVEDAILCSNALIKLKKVINNLRVINAFRSKEVTPKYNLMLDFSTIMSALLIVSKHINTDKTLKDTINVNPDLSDENVTKAIDNIAKLCRDYIKISNKLVFTNDDINDIIVLIIDITRNYNVDIFYFTKYNINKLIIK